VMSEPRIFRGKGELEKSINTESDLELFLKGETFNIYLNFLTKLNDNVKGRNNEELCEISPINQRILDALEILSKWVDDIPPTQQPTRFGNKAYREWFDKMDETSIDMMKNILPEELQDASGELAAYWILSFGNRTRIDYGTGHETNFSAWMCCLDQLGLLNHVDDYYVIVTRVFNRYLKFLRKLQTVYWLEPAGSHGVWSLDDYQFLPFYWGSSQLIGVNQFTPISVKDHEIVDENCEKYIYFGCIKFITTVKTGLFEEHSPILDSISNVVHWLKVNQGMMKMYKAEVLGKFPVMQHFLFGTLLPWN